ncbi:MAG: hypothetical protein MR516_05395, partial [Bacteroidales bacterium]|nr:hypothetical protein [Bacteroidales bacterium]
IKSADCPFSVFFPLSKRVQYLLSQGSEYIFRYKNSDLYWFIQIFQPLLHQNKIIVGAILHQNMMFYG